LRSADETAPPIAATELEHEVGSEYNRARAACYRSLPRSSGGPDRLEAAGFGARAIRAPHDRFTSRPAERLSENRSEVVTHADRDDLVFAVQR